MTPGQAHDAPPCKTLLDNLQPGQHVLADKAYDADWIRDMIWEQGAIDVIPPKANRKLPAEFDAEIYRERNKIERFFGRLKASFRRIATRYEKTSRNFLSMIKLASVRLWIEFYESAAQSNVPVRILADTASTAPTLPILKNSTCAACPRTG